MSEPWGEEHCPECGATWGHIAGYWICKECGHEELEEVAA